MESSREDDAGGGDTQNQNPKPSSKSRGSKGKSCKGCLYYSSLHKSKSRSPTCVGLSRTIHEVPSYIVGETELEASKEGRTLADFKYACVGYSVYLNNKDISAESQDRAAKLPFCVGLEVLLDKGPSTAPVGQVPSAYKSEDGQAIPPPQRHRPSHSTTGDEFLSRFKRNANVVASGVAKNLNRVTNYVKESLDDFLYPYRRRPK